MRKTALHSPVKPPRSTGIRLVAPAFVTQLLKGYADEEAALDELCQAVATGNDATILTTAKRLAELRGGERFDAGKAETSHDLPA